MSDKTETAILAGGCFWIMQQLLRAPDGVVSTRGGFTGGVNENPTEDDNDGHAEAVEVVFDPERISYRELLELFIQTHRADLDASIVGSDYRSEIFYTTEEQREIAERTIADADAVNHWPGKMATRITPADRLWPAEPDQQDYFLRNPHGCSF